MVAQIIIEGRLRLTVLLAESWLCGDKTLDSRCVS